MNYKDIVFVPIITGLVGMLKIIGMPKKYAPMVSFLTGIVFGIVFVSDGDIKRGALEGMITGLASCGLYSNGKELAKNIHENKEEN